MSYEWRGVTWRLIGLGYESAVCDCFERELSENVLLDVFCFVVCSWNMFYFIFRYMNLSDVK